MDLSDEKSSSSAQVHGNSKGGSSDDNEQTLSPHIPNTWSTNPQNAMTWGMARKTTIVTALIAANLIASISSTAFEPALGSVMADLHFESSSLASFTVSVYTLGYVFGPLIVAPISEMFGRTWILHPSFLVFSVSLVVCSVSKNLPLFIIFRTLQGASGVGFLILGPAVVADIISKDKRGLALSLMSAGPVLGPTLGPVIGGYVYENTTWRWTFWSSLVALATVYVIMILVFKETYGPVLLMKQGIATERMQNVSTKKSLTEDLQKAWLRPFRLLFQSPVLILLSLFSAITTSYAMICFATFGTIFQETYNFTPGQSGLAYFGLTVGFIFGQATIGSFSDRYVKYMEARHGESKPEHRLPPIFIGMFSLPIGFFWYGWSLEVHTHWIVPIIGSAFIAIGIIYIYLPVQIYTVDLFTVFSASAVGVCVIIRSTCSALLPLSASPLYSRFGYGWGNSLLAFVAMAFIPIAALLVRYGERIRKHSQFRTDS